MQAVTLLNFYIGSNLLLLLAAAGVATLRWARRRQLLRASYRRHLQAAYALTLGALLMPLAALPFGASSLPAATPGWAQIWSGTSMRQVASAAAEPHVAMRMAEAEVALPLDAARGITALVGAGALLLLLTLWRELQRVRGVIGAAHCIARRGSLQVLAGADVGVPFAFWVPGRHYIVVPTELLALRSQDLRLALRHEGQHHRQLDTRLIHAYQLLRALYWLNPAMHWLQRRVSELQEFACDEALIEQQRASVRGYCGTLLRLAESAVASRRSRLSLGMLGGRPDGALRARVEALLAAPALQARNLGILVSSSLLLAVMLIAAVTAAAAVQDRRITLQQARAMASVARVDSSFPVTVNARVLQQLNQLLGTPDGRAFVRASLERMEQYRSLITAKAAQYALPTELLAVPLAESGFRNLPAGKDPRHGAGIWMFIAPTARRYGLAVNASQDQRLDVAAQTDAAMRMLAELQQQFGDWELALLAYNAGSRTVQRGIEATGVRDAWHIIEQGYENDPNYVAAVMAMLLILRNPAVVQ